MTEELTDVQLAQLAVEEAEAETLEAVKKLKAFHEAQENSDSGEEDPKTKTKDASESTFTNAEVEQKIKSRLARQQASMEGKIAASDSALKVALETIEGYEVTLKKQVEAMIENVDASTKKILAKLTIAEQLEWLADPENTITQRAGSLKVPMARTDEKEVKHEKERQYI